jgi:hypothetical protein
MMQKAPHVRKRAFGTGFHVWGRFYQKAGFYLPVYTVPIFDATRLTGTFPIHYVPVALFKNALMGWEVQRLGITHSKPSDGKLVWSIVVGRSSRLKYRPFLLRTKSGAIYCAPNAMGSK